MARNEGTNRVAELEEKLRDVRAEIDRLKYRNALLERRLREQPGQSANEMVIQLQMAKTRVAAFENSHSWRFTAPLRWLTRLFRMNPPQ
jgi:hypothetical protein